MISRTLALFCFVVAALVAIASSASAFRVFPEDRIVKDTSKLKDWPTTITSLNVSAYLGRWYQMYADAFVLDTFSNNSFCATATYGPTVDPVTGHVGVLNWERQYSIYGNVRNITGYAYQTEPTQHPGRLSVTLNGAGVNAPYWIFDISPISATSGQYEWAIVSDYFKLTLFILARDPETYNRKYDAEVLNICRARGFTGFSAPIKVAQSPACNYNKPR